MARVLSTDQPLGERFQIGASNAPGLLTCLVVDSTAAGSIAPAAITPGLEGQAIITIGGVAVWSNDFQLQTPRAGGGFVVDLATGFFQVGTDTAGAGHAATVGNFRVFAGFTAFGRATGDAADVQIFDWSGTVFTVGSAAITNGRLVASISAILIAGASNYNFSQGTMVMSALVASFQYTINGFSIIGQANATAALIAQPLALQGMNATGTGATFGASIALVPGTGNTNGNVTFGFSASANGDNGLSRGLVIADALAEPTASTAGRMAFWSATGGIPSFRTAAGNVWKNLCVSAATATAGGGAITPATVSEFLTCNFNGNVRKIALYAA
jgi:hypothetical protein